MDFFYHFFSLDLTTLALLLFTDRSRKSENDFVSPLCCPLEATPTSTGSGSGRLIMSPGISPIKQSEGSFMSGDLQSSG